jgi:hypothetical protein
MFGQLAIAAAGASGAGAIGAWARVENAACAQRLFAIADVLQARMSADDSADREQWCIDNWDAVAAEVAAAHNVSLGVASHQLMVAMALRERLPRVGEVFAAGEISYRLVNAIVYRTALICDLDARAKVDAELAAAAVEWGSMSVAKIETAIDYWVDCYDPNAVRRIEHSARGRHVDVVDAANGSGVSYVEGQLFSHDAAALDKRLDAMARSVCEADPRTLEQRRADALGALAHGGDRLACLCGGPDCAGADTAPSAVVVNVIAEEKSLSDDTAVQLDGAGPPGPTAAQLREMTIAEALAQPPPTGSANTNPAVVMGGGILPAPLLAAKLANTATIRPVIHPGDSPPEPRYVPSAALARFVRCRDLTCRFPGCDESADICDLDHTISYPGGPTCASNIKCLCRKHHLFKTFHAGPAGWTEIQIPDGTIVWTSPSGRTHTTKPLGALFFPQLAQPTGTLVLPGTGPPHPDRGLAMPTRNAPAPRSAPTECNGNAASTAPDTTPTTESIRWRPSCGTLTLISPPGLLSPSLPWRVAYQKGRSMPPAGPLREGSPKMNGRMGMAPTSAGTRGETPLSNGVGAGVGAGGVGAGAAVPANPNAAAASAPKATVTVANFFMANLPSVGSGKESPGTRTPAIRLLYACHTSFVHLLFAF